MKKILEFDNQHDSEVELDLEPYGETFVIPPSRTIELHSDEINDYFRICIRLSKSGHPELSVWSSEDSSKVSLELQDE